MTASLLRRAVLPALAASALSASTLLVALPALAQETVPVADASSFSTAATPTVAIGASDEVVDAAAEWLAGELSDAGLVTGSFPGEDGAPIEFTDYGRSLDSALALLAAGGQDTVLGRTLASVEKPEAVKEYTQGAPFDQADAAYVGGTAKLALVVELTGGDATDVGGVDLLAQLRSLATDGGRFADRSSFGSFANVYGHAFALLALDAAGSTPGDDLVQGLLAAQCPDGSFPQEYEPAAGEPCAGQVDATGLVLQALGALGRGGDAPAQQAAAWLTEQQQPDGSFPGEAPVNSAGYAVLGFHAVGASSGDAVAWLTDQQNADGGLSRGAGEDRSSDLFATAQALPALAGTTFVDSARFVARQVVEPAPAPTSPAPTTPAPAAPGTTAPGAAAPVAAAPGTATLAGSGTAGRALPRTGSEAVNLLLLAVVLTASGALLTVAGRPRRRGRHAAA